MVAQASSLCNHRTIHASWESNLKIEFHPHAKERMAERGASEAEVIAAI